MSGTFSSSSHRHSAAWSTELNLLVQTQHILFTPSTYLVRTIIPEYVLGTYWYVLCLQKYCSGCCFMSYACGKRYHVCVTNARFDTYEITDNDNNNNITANYLVFLPNTISE
jgi:hypothetical protein